MTTATLAATPGASPSPTGTKSPVAYPSFSLDAARVSKVNDPGDMRGLASIKPGSRVWLMLYYTVSGLPRKMRFTTTYDVVFDKRTVYKVSYQNVAKPTDVGRFSRYTPFTAPATLPLGHYVFHATLTIGTDVRTRHWNFSVARHERMATTHS